jgi:hypothetical protein
MLELISSTRRSTEAGAGASGRLVFEVWQTPMLFTAPHRANPNRR